MANLPEDIMQEIKEVINIFDRSGDGKVDVNDIINILRSLDLNPSSKDWETHIKQYQIDNISRIDEAEFAGIYEQEMKKKKANAKDMMEAIKAVDPQNGPGLVSTAALTRYLTSIGDTLTHEQCDSILSNVLDKDKKNVVVGDLLKLVTGEA